MDLIKATLDASTKGVQSLDDLPTKDQIEYQKWVANTESQSYKQLKEGK